MFGRQVILDRIIDLRLIVKNTTNPQQKHNLNLSDAGFGTKMTLHVKPFVHVDICPGGSNVQVTKT